MKKGSPEGAFHDKAGLVIRTVQARGQAQVW